MTVDKQIGLSKRDSEVAARALANAGLLTLGFDCDAQFTREVPQGAGRRVRRFKLTG